MRRVSTLAAASTSLSRAILASSEHHHEYNKLFQAASFYAANTGSSRRWFSSSVGSTSPGGYSSTAAKVFLSLGCVAASVAAGASSLFVEEEAYAKEPISPDLVPKEVVLYQYESCPFCNKVKGKTFILSPRFTSSTPQTRSSRRGNVVINTNVP